MNFHVPHAPLLEPMTHFQKQSPSSNQEKWPVAPNFCWRLRPLGPASDPIPTKWRPPATTNRCLFRIRDGLWVTTHLTPILVTPTEHGTLKVLLSLVKYYLGYALRTSQLAPLVGCCHLPLGIYQCLSRRNLENFTRTMEEGDWRGYAR